MKKLLLTWTLILAMGLLTACGGIAVVTPPVEETPAEDAVTERPESNGEAVKTGLAMMPGIAESVSAGETNGVAQSDITLVAVTVGEDGVIDRCVIDAIQAKIEFGADGALVTALDTMFATKNELGTDYGMGQWSPIGKEWDEQMEALARYAEGKTVAELLTQTEAGTPVDLAASCTVYVGGMVEAIAQAVENAQHLGAVQGDELRLTAVTGMSDSTDATAEAAGLAQAYATAAAITFQGDVITSCAVDAVQSNVEFDAAGAITTDLSVAPLTKNQLGTNYGMSQYSSIGKDWDEQAAGFAAYVVGKTVDEVTGIALNEKGAAADADLAASCTMSIGGFQAVIAKAAA